MREISHMREIGYLRLRPRCPVGVDLNVDVDAHVHIHSIDACAVFEGHCVTATGRLFHGRDIDVSFSVVAARNFGLV